MALRIRYNSDVVTGAIVLCVVGIGWYRVRTIPFQGLQAGLGPAFFPTILLTIVTFLAIILLLKGLFFTKKVVKSESRTEEVEQSLLVRILLTSLFIAYAFLFKYLGVLISSGIFLLVAFLLLRIKPTIALIITIITVGLVYLVFGLLFRLNLF